MLELAVVIAIFLICFFLILRDFKFSVYILLILSVFMHKELFSFYRWDLLPVRGYIFAVLCAGIVKLYTRFVSSGSRSPKGKGIDVKFFFSEIIASIKEPFVAALLFYWIAAGVSIYFSKNMSASVSLFGFLTAIVALGIYLYFSLRENTLQVVKYIKFYTYTVFALTLFGYIQMFLFMRYNIIIGALWNVPENLPRLGSLFWDVNQYGALLAVVLPIIAIFAFTEKNIKLKLLNILMFISIAAAVFLTNSRSSWILAGVEFLVLLSVLLFKKIGVKGVMYVLIGLIIISAPIGYFYSIKSSPFRAAIRNYFHYRMDSYDSHFLLLQGAVEVFEKYPYLGGGYGSFFEQFSSTKTAPVFFGRDPAALSTRVPAHTIWGELVSETGILGLSAYLLFSCVLLMTLLYMALKSTDLKNYLLSAGMFSAIVGLYVAGIFYSYNTEFFWIILFLYFIWAHSIVRNQVSFSEILSSLLGSTRSLLLIVLVVSALILFVNLGTNHLVPWDEAIYAKISKNMVVSGNWLDMYWKPNKVWYEKPPLYMWLMAGAMKVIGVNEWAARLPSAILGFLSVVIVFMLGSKWFSKTTGFISALILLTTVQFIYYSRSAMTDVSTTFFILLSIYFYSFAKDKGKLAYWILSGVSIGLGVMIKGVVGLIPFPIIFLYEIYALLTKSQKFTKKLVWGYVTLIVSALVVFMPWHIFMYEKYGMSFLKNYIGYHVWDRATESIEDKGKPFFWYLTVIKVSMRVWFLVLIPGLIFSIFKIIKKDSRYVLLVIWALFIFFFFSIAKSKLIWYIIPIYPALAIIAGNFIDTVLKFVYEKFSRLNTVSVKFLTIFVLFIFGFFYLFLNRNLAFSSDLTGSEARLLQLKDSKFGTKDKVYVDRIEDPVVMFYTDSPYEVIDFEPTKKDRVPEVDPNVPLILLTKSGRYSSQVIGKTYPPVVVQYDGDYVLWYFDSKVDHDAKVLAQQEAEAKQAAALLQK